MSANFENFQQRLNDLREKASEYADKEDINKSLDAVEKAWQEAAKAASLMECEPVKAALEATERSSSILAYNVLFSDTSAVSPDQLMSSVIKFQALERIRGAFLPVMAQAMEESVEAGILANEIEKK